MVALTTHSKGTLSQLSGLRAILAFYVITDHSPYCLTRRKYSLFTALNNQPPEKAKALCCLEAHTLELPRCVYVVLISREFLHFGCVCGSTSFPSSIAFHYCFTDSQCRVSILHWSVMRLRVYFSLIFEGDSTTCCDYSESCLFLLSILQTEANFYRGFDGF